ncbi:MAG: hypothetical protein VX702_04610, partial [Pseudomonadota bacterium]|nr:hypothetical protein [Pseudomonadota bacterium]
MRDTKRQSSERRPVIGQSQRKHSCSINITVPVSVGEVIDKVTILEIKSEKISDRAKLKNVETELEALRPLVSGGVFDSDEMVELTNGLRRVNGELWDIEDNIRAGEAAGRF